MSHSKDAMKGFTLMELMFTLAVAAVLLGLAAPSFTDILKNTRLTTQMNNLASAINFTRSEAVKTGLPATICKSNDGASCSGNWQDGWLIFTDIDADGVVDAADDQVIRVGETLSASDMTLVFPGRNRITYSPDGFASGSFNSTFKFCDSRGGGYAKGLIVSIPGRVRTAADGDITDCI